MAFAHSTLGAINTFKAKPHPLPPTHPNLAAGFSIFPFLSSQQCTLLFPDLLSAPSSSFPNMLSELKITCSELQPIIPQ